MGRKYTLGYEDGKCPEGFEYVKGYTNLFSGRWIDGYCRKIRKRQSRRDRKYGQHEDQIFSKIEGQEF
jgi:hypothetical protein